MYHITILRTASHRNNVDMHRSAAAYIEQYGTLLEIGKKRKLRGFGHAMRAKGTVANTIL